MASSVQEMRKTVEQLRQEASIQRVSVSESLEQLVMFVEKQSTTDSLLTGMIPADNPFRDQKGCTIL